MTSPAHPNVMVAPTGARRMKSDHPALPITIEEITAEAVACAAAGADATHLHVRDSAGRHSLDPGLYREAIAAIHSEIPSHPIQITTEAAGIFDVPDQIATLEALRPAAASIAVREMARSADLAPRAYALCRESGTRVQHIVFDNTDWALLQDWHASGIITPQQTDVIFVLGRYAPPLDARPEDLATIAKSALGDGGNWTICAFGPAEQSVLLAAAQAGANLRIGFENNIHAPDGSLAASNATNVAALTTALTQIP